MDTIAVTGATGRQGGAVVEHLLRSGRNVRALTRAPLSESAQRLRDMGAEVRQADLEDPSSLKASLEGVSALFAVTNYWDGAPGPILGAEGEIRQGGNLIGAAEAAGVGHVVLSTASGTFGRKSDIAHIASKQQIEARLLESPLSWTIIRPVFFMQNLTVPWMGVWEGLQSGRLDLPLADHRKLQMVSVTDIGAFAVLAFDDPSKFQSTAFDLAGDALSGAQIAAILSNALGRTIEFTGSTAMIEFLEREHPDGAAMWRDINAYGNDAFIPGLRALHPDLKSFEDFASSLSLEPV